MATEPKSEYFLLEEYYAIEAASERRWEYRDGQVVCMSGGSRQHGRISSNIHIALAGEGGSCEAFTADTAVAAPMLPPYCYPDASVACDAEFRTHQLANLASLDLLVNPVLIVEVQSPSSRNYDEGAKFEGYKSIPSFREYILIEQAQRKITHWVRTEAGAWDSAIYTDGSFPLFSVPAELSIEEVYRRVDFSPRPE